MSPRGDGRSSAHGRRRQLLRIGLVVVLVALAGCEGVQPVPQVCQGCSDEGAGDALPPDARTGGSTTHLFLEPETGGSPRVVARTEVDAETAAEFRRNESRREAVRTAVVETRDVGWTTGPGYEDGTPTPRYEGAEGRDRYPVPAFEARDLSVRLDAGDRLVVDFRVAGIPGVAPTETPPLARRELGGTVLVDRFDVRDGRNPHPRNDGVAYRLSTDRFVVHAPPGTRPVAAPDHATVHDDRVVLRSLPADTRLVFAPAGPGGTLAAHATLTADALGWIVPDSFWMALLPALQLSLLLGGLRAGNRGSAGTAGAALLLAVLLTGGPLAVLVGPVGLLAVGVVVAAVGALVWYARRGSRTGTEGEAAEGDSAVEGSAAGAVSDRRLPTVAALRARVEPWLVPTALVGTVAAALTLVAAATVGDGPVHGLLFLGGGVLPLVGVAGLGRRRAADTERPFRRRLFVLVVLVAPWLFAVGHVAGREIPDGLEALVAVMVWGTGITVAAFVVHAIASRARLRSSKQSG